MLAFPNVTSEEWQVGFRTKPCINGGVWFFFFQEQNLVKDKDIMECSKHFHRIFHVEVCESLERYTCVTQTYL